MSTVEEQLKIAKTLIARLTAEYTPHAEQLLRVVPHKQRVEIIELLRDAELCMKDEFGTVTAQVKSVVDSSKIGDRSSKEGIKKALESYGQG